MPQEKTELDALQLLSADHRKVEELFEQFEKAKGAAKKQELVLQICTELKVHAMIEEEIIIQRSAARWRTMRSTKPMSSMTARRC